MKLYQNLFALHLLFHRDNDHIMTSELVESTRQERLMIREDSHSLDGHQMVV